jgi:hypothetical protein
MAQVLVFPFKGVNVGVLPSEQPDQTSSLMSNVRPYWKGRLRGGQRPGLKKWGAGTLIGGTELPVVAMCSVTTVR